MCLVNTNNLCGLCGLNKNYAATQRWVRTTHERCKYLELTQTMADLNDSSLSFEKHKDLRPVEILKSELAVNATIDAIENFVNPFTISDKDHLYSLSSGLKIPEDIEKDILKAERVGNQEKQRFITERLKENDKFFEPVKRTKLKTMGDLNKKVRITGTQNKVVELKQQGNIAFQLLVKSQTLDRNLDLQEVMKYQLTPVPYSLGSCDGFLGKTNKAKGMNYITQEVSNSASPEATGTLLIVNGNAVFHSLSELPETFGDIT